MRLCANENLGEAAVGRFRLAGHDRDLLDARDLAGLGLVRKDRLREYYTLSEPQLIRYPALDPASFRAAVNRFCDEPA